VRIRYPNHLVATLLRMLQVDESAAIVPAQSGHCTTYRKYRNRNP
jgi:hypothetical protein